MSTTSYESAPEEDKEEGSSVGVIGWLGFVVINTAAWGIVSVSWNVTWVLGFALLLSYTVLLFVFAVMLERRGPQFRQFVNMFWTLGCTFIFVSGAVFSVQFLLEGNFSNAWGSVDPGSQYITIDNNLCDGVLPSSAPQALVKWACNESSYFDKRYPNTLAVGQRIYFTGMDKESGDRILYYSSGSSINEVEPQVTDPISFREFDSRLFVSALDTTRNREIFSVSSDGKATMISSFVDEDHDPSDLFVSGDRLYFKGSYHCPWHDGAYYSDNVQTIFYTDGSPGKVVDLREGVCEAASKEHHVISDDGPSVESGDGQLAIPNEVKKPMWGTLLCGVVPMMAVAAFALAYKHMPGTFLNLYLGVQLAVFLLMGLADFPNEVFLKGFKTLYALALWIGIVVGSIRTVNIPLWCDELKTWAVVIVATDFFFVLHWQLDIPWTNLVWPWFVYGFVVALQILASFIVLRSFPTILSAISFFMIAWRISYGVVQVLGLSGTTMALTMLMILMLLGIGIIVVAVLYASRRQEVEAAVQECTAKLRSSYGDAVV